MSRPDSSHFRFSSGEQQVQTEPAPSKRKKRDRFATQKRLEAVVVDLQLRAMQAERQHGVLKAKEVALRDMIHQQGNRLQSIAEKSPLPGQDLSLRTLDTITAAELVITQKLTELGISDGPAATPESSSSSSSSAATRVSTVSVPERTYVDQILMNLQTPEQLERFKAMTSDAYREAYCSFAEIAAVLLADPMAEAEEAVLFSMLDEIMVTMLGVQLVNPDVAWDAAGRNVRTGEPAEAPKELWPRAAATLILSREQRKKLAGAYSNFVRAQAATAAEREGLLQQLEAETSIAGATMSSRHEELLQALERFMKRIKECGVALINCGINTLTKRQLATYIVATYPYWADAVPLCKVVFEDFALGVPHV